MLCLKIINLFRYLNFDQIIIILQRTLSRRRRVIMKRFCCCSVATASKIFAVIGIISYALSIYILGYEQISASNVMINVWNTNIDPIERGTILIEIKETFGVESINFFYKTLNIGIAQCVFSGIGIICCILPFCGHVMPLLIFIPVDFIKGVVFIIMVGYVMALCSITKSSDQNNQLIFFSCTA